MVTGKKETTMKYIAMTAILTLAMAGGTLAMAHGHGHHHGRGQGQCQGDNCKGQKKGKQQARGQHHKQGPGDCTGNQGCGPRDGTGYGTKQGKGKTK